MSTIPRTTPTQKEYKALQIATCGMFSMYIGRDNLVAEGFWKSERVLTDRDIVQSGVEMYDRIVDES